MIDVKRPVLLDADLNPVRVLEPQNVSITLNSPGTSQATIILGPDDPEPPMHAWTEIFNINGSVGIFRVAVPGQDYTQQQSIVLFHGIDSLADSHWIGQEEFEGTVEQLLTRLLTFQTARVKNQMPWHLGTCQCTAQKKLSINYDRLSDLLAKIEEDESDYYFSYDQTTFPWTINFLQKPTEADSEFRLNRNVRTISKSENDNELCNQLILSVNVSTTVSSDTGDATSTDTVIRTYDNAAAQAIYGIIQRTADIDTNDDIANEQFPEADTWADRFLRERATPTLQLQIEGDELKRVTGDNWDEAKLAHICRVELPKYGISVSQRAVSIAYPEALSDPSRVTISLSTQLPKFSSSISSLQKQSAATAAAARSIARSAAKAKEMTHWSMVVTDQQLALDGTGIMQLYESGIDMDAQDGVKIYNLSQGLQSLYSGIEAQAGRIDLVVQGNGSSASIKIQAIVDGINGSVATINADRIKIGTTGGASVTLDSKISLDTDGYINLNGTTVVRGNLALTQNYGVSARNFTVGTGGNIRLIGSQVGEFYDLSASNMPECIRGLQFVVDPNNSGHFILQKKTIYNSASWTDEANFNIAATQFYQDGVAAAAASGAASHNVSSISSITLYQSDAGQVVTKYPTITYSNGDTTSIAQSVDLTGIAAGADASQIDLANASDIFWVNSGGEGSYTFTSLGNLGATIMSHTSDRGYVMFYARITGGTGQKLYGIPIG